MVSSKKYKIFIIAGEASGDLLGGRLLKALKQQAEDTGINVDFKGVGGSLMQQEGLVSLFPMEELSLMGAAEIIPHLPNLIRRINQTADTAVDENPDVIISIDSPDFCFRVIKKIKKQTKNIPCVHYVAPSVWAWRPKRAKKVAQFLDHILALLPFEPPYFEREGLPCTFIGHSIVETEVTPQNQNELCQKYGLNKEKPVLCLLPGSRGSELKRLLPLFKDTAEQLQKKYKKLQFVMPTLPHLKPKLDAAFVDSPVQPIFITDSNDKQDAYALSTLALAASGTVALELGMAGVPTVIGYKMGALSSYLAKKLIKLNYVSLINIILDKPVMPEYLLENCTVENLTQALDQLLSNDKKLQSQKEDCAKALSILKGKDSLTPSQRAAHVVLNLAQAT